MRLRLLLRGSPLTENFIHPFSGFRSNSTAIQKGAQADDCFDGASSQRAVLIQHLTLRRFVTPKQGADQQRLVLVQLIDSRIRGAMKLDQALLAAPAEE